MAITFLKQQKKQKYLIMVFAVVVVATFFVWWYGFSGKDRFTSPQTPPPAPPKEVVINFNIFDTQFFKELLPFEEILPLIGQPGRTNPFSPL